MTQEELFEQHKNIVYYCFSRLYKDEFVEKSKEDLVQEGFLSLWKCCSFYNEALDIKMSTYAFAAIQNAMLRWIKNNKNYYYNFISLEEPIKDSCEKDITIGDTIPDYSLIESAASNVDDILCTYKKWLIKTRVNSNQTYINNRVYRANIILNELITRGKVSAQYIQDEYDINRNLVNKIFKELRESLKEEYPTKYSVKGSKTNEQN